MISQLTMIQAGAADVAVELIYLLHDPFAVHMEFTQPDGDVVLWSISREVMRLGLSSYKPMGDGDISCGMCWHRGRQMFHLCLKPPEGTAHLCGEIANFRSFLHATYLAVPPGRENERIDYDREIAKLLE